MKQKTRKILFFVFSLAFFIITPIIFLYASGYRLSNGTLKKSGLLILDSEPAGAMVFLNDQPQKPFFENLTNLIGNQEEFSLTPAKIKNLPAGEYQIKMDLQNHWPWEKKLTIHEGAATFAENVVLFKKNLPEIITGSGENARAFFSPDGRLTALKDENGLRLVNLETGVAEISTESADNVIWAENGDYLLFGRQIYSLSNSSGKPKKINSLEIGAQNFKWSEDNNQIYYLLKNSLKAHSLVSGKNEIIKKENSFHDFYFKDGKLFTLTDDGKKSLLKMYAQENGELIKTMELPLCPEARIKNGPGKLLAVHDESGKTLYLLDPDSYWPLKETITNIVNFRWPEDNQLFYANDFEIWIQDLTSGQKILLTRISQEIKNIFWHPSNNYIIYLTEKNANIMELDDREKRNILPIANLDKINDSFLDEKAKYLFFSGEIGSQKGLYRLEL